MILQPLVDAHAILAAEQQLHLTDVVGERDFAVDLETGRIRFGDELTYRAELLGSEAPGPGTWMWGWANPAGFGDQAATAARALRELGRDRGWAAFTEGEVPLDGDLTGARLAIAAVGHVGAPAFYAAPLGGGARAFLLLGGPGLTLPEPETPRLVAALSQVLADGEVDDWPTALGAYAGQRGLTLTRRDDAMLLAAPELDGRVRISFDDLGRVAGIKAVGGRRGTRRPGSGSDAGSESDGGAATRRGLFTRLRLPD